MQRKCNFLLLVSFDLAKGFLIWKNKLQEMCVGLIELSPGIFLLGSVEWGSHKVFHPDTVKVCVGSPLN